MYYVFSCIWPNVGTTHRGRLPHLSLPGYSHKTNMDMDLQRGMFLDYFLLKLLFVFDLFPNMSLIEINYTTFTFSSSPPILLC